MLFFVYHPRLVAVVVGHDAAAGEFVCQLPYFPPHQAPDDFSEVRTVCIKIENHPPPPPPPEKKTGRGGGGGDTLFNSRSITWKALFIVEYLNASGASPTTTEFASPTSQPVCVRSCVHACMHA